MVHKVSTYLKIWKYTGTNIGTEINKPEIEYFTEIFVSGRSVTDSGTVIQIIQIFISVYALSFPISIPLVVVNFMLCTDPK